MSAQVTIVEKIKASIQNSVFVPRQETVNGQVVTVYDPLPVYYHDEPTLNLLTSSMSFPCALLQLLSSGRIDRTGPQKREAVTAAVFFVEPSQFDFDAEANEVIIDRCKTNAMTWLSSLNTSGLLEASGLVRTSRVYDRYDDILTGFGVSVDLTELDGICII